MIIPLIKAKNGDLTDVNNYRAIAVSTAISKLSESVIADPFTSVSPIDMYQFGFLKSVILLDCVLVYLNVPLITTLTTAVMFSFVLLILPKRLIRLTVGNF